MLAASQRASEAGEPSDAGATIFRLFSEPNEVVGGPIAAGLNGGEWIDDAVSVELLAGDRVEVLIRNNEFGDTVNTPVFRLVFGPKPGEALAPGGYLNARQSGYATQPAPELQFERIERDPPVRICSRSFGMFEVLDFSVDESGSLASFAADFQFSCATTGEGPWSLGSIRYQSAAPLDYDVEDEYPVLSGTVTGPDGDPLINAQILSSFLNVRHR